LSTARGSAGLLSLGRVEYGRALELQRGLWRLRVDDTAPDTLVLLEHEPVVTLGRSAKASNLLVSEAELARRGVALHRIERGGDATFHGPGQLVGYPVFKLEAGLPGVRRFVERIEAVLVAALADLRVEATLKPGLIGVWCEERKIASLGIAVKRRVAFHGFALNVSVDLDWFGLINPCGMPGVRMTSVAREGGIADDARVRAAVVAAFEREFGVELQAKLPRILTSLTDRLRISSIPSTSDRV
jgi:lipoate-protein ligase B